MSVNAGVENGNTQGQPTGDNSQGAGTGQPNNTQPPPQQQETRSPYADYLEKLPETARPLVEPVFKEWDAGVNQRFQQLHSEYSWAKPWEEIAKEYEPEAVSQAVQLFQALNNDPEGFYKALAEAYNFEQGQPGQQQQNNEDDPLNPRLTQIEAAVQQLAELITGQQQTQQQQQEEQAFIDHLTELHNKHGEFDVDYVLAKIAAGEEPEKAVLAYRSLVGAGAANTQGANAPVVMGNGGGLPSQTVDPKQFDRRQTQQYVESVLAAQNKGT